MNAPTFPGDRRTVDHGRRCTDAIDGDLALLQRLVTSRASNRAVLEAARLLARHGMQEAHVLLLAHADDIVESVREEQP